MKKESGVTLITVVIMIIVISVIATVSIVSSRAIFDESKEEVLKKNRYLVETAVSKYAAKVETSGFLSPANEELPGSNIPSFEYVVMGNVSGEQIKKVTSDYWYILSKDSLEEIGITYAEEEYLVNYKKNIVVPLSEQENIYSLIEYYEEK